MRTKKIRASGLWGKIAHCAAVLALVAGAIPPASVPAQAQFGGSKTLTILHMHTGEQATITFKRGGSYDQQALQKLNWLLRDWRTDEPTKMDPRLFDLLAEVYEESGSRQPIRVVSAYRSPRTNAMLRQRSRMVAEHSQHMLGKAMDFYLTDVSSEKIRAIGVKLQDGGVGYYPTANTPFTHLDVGGVRAWPRMSRAQLANLFPDGKTVHIPADGRPLARYEEAKAMILARGGKVSGQQYAMADASSGSGDGKSFWSRLFGGRDEEEDQEIVSPRATRTAARNAPVQQVASSENDGDRAVNFFTRTPPRMFGGDAPAAPVAQPVPVRVAAAPVQPDARPIPVAFAPIPAPTIPLPPARQVATLADTKTGPQMVWQSGAAGQNSDNPFKAAHNDGKVPFTTAQRQGNDGMNAVMAYAPLPPSRPDTVAAASKRGSDLADASITTASLPRAPLPPSRPTAAPVKVVLAAAPAKPAAAVSAKAQAPQKVAAKAPTAPKAKPGAKNSAGSKVAVSGTGSFTRSAYVDLPTNEFSGSAFKATGKK